VTDISVHGGVGYPLTFARTSNSRGSSATAFGAAGSWTHNWQWTIDPLTLYGQSSRNAVPTYYNVRYPDGRVINFGPVHQNGDPDYHGPLGVRDRMEPVPGHTSNDQNCYVRLPDGGEVWFIASHDNSPSDPDFGPYTVTWTYRVAGLIDPYGQLTTIAFSPDGNTETITEPAGRNLVITSSGGVVSKVDEHMTVGGVVTRTVTYIYTPINFGGTNYSCLTSVTNYDGTTSTYTYQASNISPGNGRPLLKTCVDRMYPGPMWMIAYIYSGSTIYGQLLSENYYNGAIGAAVSTLTIGSNTRTEQRGDGPTRTFTYTGYQLTGVTDFKGVGSSIAYDSGGFPNAVTDFNGNTTNFTSKAFNGAQLSTTYPLTPSDGGTRAVSANVFGSSSCPDVNNRDGNNPYYLYSTANKQRRHHKRGFGATYLRDSSKRVTTTTYLDGGTETFTYDLNGSTTYGQVVSHRLKSGGLEVYEYDARRRLTAYRDPYHLSAADPQNPTVPTSATASLTYTYYESGTNQDLVNSVTDGNNVVTTLTYNARGQVLTTKIGTATVATNVYNSNGNGTLANVTDERGKKTSFTYDDYKRLLTTALPPPNGGASPPPTYIGYNPSSNTIYTDDTHTDANPRVTLPPAGGSVSSKPSPYMTQVVYDNNYRKTSVIVSPGADGDNSWDEAITVTPTITMATLRRSKTQTTTRVAGRWSRPITMTSKIG